MFALRNEKFRLFIGKALYHDFEVLFSHFHPEVFFAFPFHTLCISIPQRSAGIRFSIPPRIGELEEKPYLSG